MKNFKKVYTPDRDICVDESLLGFKGILNIIQYFPMKTIKRGFKFFYVNQKWIFTGNKHILG